jgi:hypothetical protein
LQRLFDDSPVRHVALTPSRSMVISNGLRVSKVSPQVRNTRSTTISSASRMPSPSSNHSGASSRADRSASTSSARRMGSAASRRAGTMRSMSTVARG